MGSVVEASKALRQGAGVRSEEAKVRLAVLRSAATERRLRNRTAQTSDGAIWAWKRP